MYESYRNYEFERILSGKKIKAEFGSVDPAKVDNRGEFQARMIDEKFSTDGYTDVLHLSKIREGILHNNVFPAIVVAVTPDGYVIVDGRHRFVAWKEAGITVVAYILPQNTPEPLLRLFACILNDKHGKPNSPSTTAAGDKQMSIENALKQINIRAKALPLGGTPDDIASLIREIAKDHELTPDLVRGRYQQTRVNHLLSMAEVGVVCGSVLSTAIMPLFEQGQNVKEIGDAIFSARNKGVSEVLIAETVRQAQRENSSVAGQIALLGAKRSAQLVSQVGEAKVSGDAQRVLTAFTELASVLSRKPSAYALDSEQRKQLQYYGQKIVNTVAIFLHEIGS
jgi:hypothetical protein